MHKQMWEQIWDFSIETGSNRLSIISVQFSSVTPLWLTPYSPIDCSLPSLLVHPRAFSNSYLSSWGCHPPSHPLLFPPPNTVKLSQHQGLFPWVSSSHLWWPKFWSFSFSISPSNEYSELMLLICGIGEDSWESLALQGDPPSPS